MKPKNKYQKFSKISEQKFREIIRCFALDLTTSDIENVVNNYTSFRVLSNGRTAYWHDTTGTVVIRNPKASDGGTAFQPTSGRKYFDNLR